MIAEKGDAVEPTRWERSHEVAADEGQTGQMAMQKSKKDLKKELADLEQKKAKARKMLIIGKNIQRNSNVSTGFGNSKRPSFGRSLIQKSASHRDIQYHPRNQHMYSQVMQADSTRYQSTQQNNYDDVYIPDAHHDGRNFAAPDPGNKNLRENYEDAEEGTDALDAVVQLGGQQQLAN